jgi:hypothetical protein
VILLFEENEGRREVPMRCATKVFFYLMLLEMSGGGGVRTQEMEFESKREHVSTTFWMKVGVWARGNVVAWYSMFGGGEVGAHTCFIFSQS